MEVDLRVLRDSINRTLDMIIEARGTSLTIKNGYYWNISAEELYNVTSDPTDLDIGDLEYEYELIKKIYADEDELPGFLNFHAALLRAISIEYPSGF